MKWKHIQESKEGVSGWSITESDNMSKLSEILNQVSVAGHIKNLEIDSKEQGKP